MVARDIVLPVDPDTAWEVLTDADARREWLGDDADRDAVVEESLPGERLVFWWSDDEGEPLASRVELTLTEVPGGTHVSVRESFTGPMASASASPRALAAA